MEPGQALGTGLHPSTQLCVGLIERATKHLSHLEKRSLIDVGTGTGILAIVADKLGVARVSAIDNDPIAVETARENLTMNGSTAVQLSSDSLPVFQETFDIVVSNILLETHKELAGDYRRLVKDGGLLILAGLLTQQKEEIDRLFSHQGFVLEISESWQEWLALMYVREAE
jgi:ribosomal protein L11 methyltransferase